MATTNSIALKKQIDATLKRIPGLKGLSTDEGALKEISGSGSNNIYLLRALRDNDDIANVCMRQPKPFQLLERFGFQSEVEVMRAARSCGAPVPEILGVHPLEEHGHDCLFMEWVQGEGNGSRIASGSDLQGVRADGLLGKQCGEALARIHSVDVKMMQPVLKQQAVTAREKLAEFYAEYMKLGIVRPALEYILQWLQAHLPSDADELPVVVHGDFRNGNIVVHPSTGLAGILDWEISHLGNRYEDIGWMCSPSWRHGNWELAVGGFATLESFLQGYETICRLPIDRAAIDWWVLFSEVRWAQICLGFGMLASKNIELLENHVIGRRVSEAEINALMLIADGTGGFAQVLNSRRDSDSALSSGTDVMFPTTSSLVESVSMFLKNHAVPAFGNSGDERNAFLARVAVKALGMVSRSLEAGSYLSAELASLKELLASQDAECCESVLIKLRRELQSGLRAHSIPVDRPGLLAHLLRFTAMQLSVDQPKYPSLARLRSSL